MVPAAPRARTLLPLGFDPCEAFVDLLDARAEQPPISLQLSFARTTQTDAAFLSFEMGPAPHQPRRHVAQLRELDLQLALEGARTLSEDIENETRAVNHATFQRTFQIALLRGR